MFGPSSSKAVKLPDYYVSEKRDDLRILRRETMSQAEVLSILRLYESGKAHGGATTLKEGAKSSVCLFAAPVGGETRKLCLKHYTFRGRLRTLQDALRPSRAVKSLIAAEAMLHVGIETATPFAAIERTKRSFVIESFLIMEDISGNMGLPEYLEESFSPPLNKQQRREKRTFVMRFAAYLALLHQKGLYQNDFKTTNIFVCQDRGEETSFCMIDLDHIVLAKKVPPKRKAKNLLQINTSVPATITLADRMRFYHYYTGQGKLTTRDKRLIRRIIRQSWKRNPHWHPRFGMGAKRIREWQ